MRNIFNIALIVLINIIIGFILIFTITLEMIFNFIKFDFKSSKESFGDLIHLLKMLIDYNSYTSL
jgi:Lhr-like helicase